MKTLEQANKESYVTLKKRCFVLGEEMFLTQAEIDAARDIGTRVKICKTTRSEDRAKAKAKRWKYVMEKNATPKKRNLSVFKPLTKG
jgi:hypothetical protein